MLDARAKTLSRLFGLIASAALAPAGFVACSSSGTVPAPPQDASMPVDASPASDSADAGVADAASAGDSSDAAMSCYGNVDIHDGAGPDGEELCDFYAPCGLAPVMLGAIGCRVVPLEADGAPAGDPASSGFPPCHLVDGHGCSDGGYVLLDGGVAFECIGCPGGGGRRPVGMGAVRASGCTPRGVYFAQMAALEAASVRAFAELARDLARHGAPEGLVAAARASALDEVRHARAMRRLARRFGGRASPVASRRVPPRGLASLALHNVVEGCVRETYGALLAAVQAERATDGEIRDTMRAVATDELRHAALSWEIASWADGQLRPAERAKVERSRKRALRRLAGEGSRIARGFAATFA